MTGERRREVELEAPGHPALPARVSLLMFPARGAVARLLEPRDASAVIGSIETGIRARRLRRFRGSGWRRNSDMLGDSSRTRILPHETSQDPAVVSQFQIGPMLDLENHAASIALHFMYMNYARPHKSLANPYPPTRAMAAGLADHIWTCEDIAELLD